MSSFIIKPVFSAGVKGEVVLSGDKSIAHRAVILSAITKARTVIENFPSNQDCRWTIDAFKKLGIDIRYNFKKKRVVICGKGLYGLTKPKSPVFVGDSGTTFRIILGVLAGQDFRVRLTAGRFLSKRPMRRVLAPLRMMGAGIKSEAGSQKLEVRSWKSEVRSQKLEVRSQKSEAGSQKLEDRSWKLEDRNKELKLEEYPPVTIRGGDLKAITYRMPVASAQVKSAILLAGLYAKGTTKVVERFGTRDHTECMLKLFGADIKIRRTQISVTGNKELKSPHKLQVPADISSSAFFMVLAAIIPNSHILLKKVSLNPTRRGIINVLKRMGARIKVKGQGSRVKGGEPMGDIEVNSSRLKGTAVKKEEIPSLIDELPVLMVAACFARGRSMFRAAEELRVKETDRIKSMTENLTRMGADIRVIKRGRCEDIIVRGRGELKGSRLKSFSDHRTAMSLIVAALAAKGNSRIDDIDCIDKSFPNFIKIIKDIAY